MPATPSRLRSDMRVAAVTWLVATGSVLAVVALADLDPEAAGLVPETGSRAWWLALVVVTAQAVALCLRRRRPDLVLWVVAVGPPLGGLAGMGDAITATSFPVLVAAYTATSTRPARRDAVPLTGAALLLSVAMLLARPVGDPLSAVAIGAALAQGVATVGLAVGVGAWVRTRREAADARADRIEALSREHSARIEAALAGERAAMARELHDIAAHHLSGIAVMTGAIAGQIDTDPEGAKAGVQRVRAETTAMLDELRSLVRLLRDARPAEEGGDEGVQTLAAVPALVDRARASGVGATLAVLGPGGEQVVPVEGASSVASTIGPLAQLAAYRTVQECLANVVRHAPGARCEVVLDARDPATLLITVRNGPSPGPRPARGPGADARGGGLGLVGMQERADLTDARLTFGPEPDGGWLVTLAVPRHQGAPPADAPAAGPMAPDRTARTEGDR